jgi:hypothetical protein
VEIPADVLILNIKGKKEDNQTCYMRGGLWDESESSVLKQSYRGTANRTGFRISDDRFIRSVSGTIKWDYNNQGFFSGSFKQENCVTGNELTIDNVLKRGCYFSHAEQLIGIVLNVGKHTMDSGKVQETSRGV